MKTDDEKAGEMVAAFKPLAMIQRPMRCLIATFTFTTNGGGENYPTVKVQKCFYEDSTLGDVFEWSKQNRNVACPISLEITEEDK